MRLANYHTHSLWCDGKGTLGDYVEAAVAKGFEALGFSGHAPLPFLNDWTMTEKGIVGYISDVRTLRDLYEDKLEIYLGLEVDFIEGVTTPASSWIGSLGMDYLIGAVHMLQDPKDGLCYSVDGSEAELHHLIDVSFSGDVEAMIRAYYRAVILLVRDGGFDFLAHFDLVKKHNVKTPFFDEEASWYKEVVRKTLDVIADEGIPLEMNTGALSRGYREDPYPSQWILEGCRDRGIPMLINSDAHRPEWLDYAFPTCRAMLTAAGYKTVRMLIQGRWQDVPLEEV